MSMDDCPHPQADETAEITIEVTGAVSKEDFKKFKDKIKQYLADFQKTTPGNVRWCRLTIRKKPGR